jgi:hypothetical protein
MNPARAARLNQNMKIMNGTGGPPKERDYDAGSTTCQVTIAIASEFVDAILTSKPDSE